MNPESRKGMGSTDAAWKGAAGLAEDVRHYGKWMREEAEKRIGYLYPKIEITAEMAQERPDIKSYVRRKLTVIAWLWARTVKSPNPAFADVDVPLASTFLLSTKKGKEAYVEPVMEGGGYRFTVKAGVPPESAKNGTKLARGANFKCVMSGVPLSGDYIKAAGKAGRMSVRLMAIVAKGDRSRVYLAPTPEHESIVHEAKPTWMPDVEIPPDRRSMFTPLYGLTHFKHLFTDRQLVALTTFSDLVAEALERVCADSVAAAMPNDGVPLRDGGAGATAYAEAVGVYLAFAVDRCCDFSNSCTRWVHGNQKVMSLFGKQAIAMTWDFPEAAILQETVGGFSPATTYISKCLQKLAPSGGGTAVQQNAVVGNAGDNMLVSTDPPYYDNVGYADLSDFFYIWLRKSLRPIFPDLFATLRVPKSEELIASPYRHGGAPQAEAFFLAGMTEAMRKLAQQTHPGFPATIYYAFKQSEQKGGLGISSTGWETFLDAVVRAGFSIRGTWPMRSAQKYRMVGLGTNALASAIILVCRPRPNDAPIATRREFVDALRSELPDALRQMQTGNIAPVDLAQAAIGPGMAVFTRYAKVLDASGEAVSVRESLSLINQTLDEVLAEQEGDFDANTRWALAWFEQSGFTEGDYGVAETLSKAKNTSVEGMVEARVLLSGAGKVRLLRPYELPEDWVPDSDTRLTAWEAVHHLVRVHDKEGEGATALLMSKLGPNAEAARELAYRLYRICDQKNRSQDALSYNALVQSWPEVARLAQQVARPTQVRMGLPDDS